MVIDCFGFFLFFERYKEYNSCLISFLDIFGLFPAFNYSKEIGNLLSIWSGVSIFSPIPFCSADSPLSNSHISVISYCSSNFSSLKSGISFNSNKISTIFS